MRNLLALLADISNGIFAVFFASYVTNTEIAWWYFVVGIFFAMCPDLDAIPELLVRGKIGSSKKYIRDHREGLHYPILFVILGITLSVLVGFWGYLFLFATTLHFVNDFYGTGWGIKLLWPISNTQFKLLGRRANKLRYLLEQEGSWKTLPVPEKRLRLIVSWSADELPRYIERWGVDDWVDKWYLHLNWVSVTEYSLFLFSCILLYMHFSGSLTIM